MVSQSGVWWQGAFNCHQFHANTEFFADYGTFDVKLTLPQNEVVGASGVEVSSNNNSDGTKTVTYHGGATGGFCAVIALDRANDRAVIVLSNTKVPVENAALTLLVGMS